MDDVSSFQYLIQSYIDWTKQIITTMRTQTLLSFVLYTFVTFIFFSVFAFLWGRRK